MFRNNPGLFVLSVMLVLVYGIGLLILLTWWLKCLSVTLTVTTQKTIKRTGILSKATTEVYHEDVRNIQVRQTWFQRICKVGSIGIGSAATSGLEIVLDGILNPDKVKSIIEDQRRTARGK